MKKTVTFNPNPSPAHDISGKSSQSIVNDDKLTSMKKAIDYIVKIGTPSKIAADLKSYEIFFYLKSLFNDDPAFLDENTKWRFFARTKFDLVLVRLFAYFADICEDFEISEKMRVNRAALNLDMDENGRKICMLDYLIFITNKLTDLQFRNEIMFNFNKKLLNHKLLDSLMMFFKRDKYLNKRSKWYESHDTLIGIMAAIRNLTECPYYDKKIWRRADIENVMLKFAPKTRFPNVYPKLAAEIVLNIRQKSLIECLEELNRVNDPQSILDEEFCYHDVAFIKFIVKKPLFNEYDQLIKHDCLKIFRNVLLFFLDVGLDFKKAKICMEKPIESPPLNDRRLTTCYNILTIINELIFKSIEFNLYFCDMSVYDVLSRFISDDFQNGMCLNKKRILTLVINDLYLLTRHFEDFRVDLTDLDLVNKLMNMIRVFNGENEVENQEIIVNSIYCVANLIDDVRLESMDSVEIEFMINRLVQELELIVEQVEWGELKRSNVRVSQALTGNLVVLTRFAINPRTRMIIFNKQFIFRRIIFSGSRLEKICAIKLLTQLCFTDQIADEVDKDDDLKKYAKQLSLNAKYHRLRKCSQTLLWWLENRSKSERKDYVYISHHPNRDTRRICSRIKQKLEKHGIRSMTAEQLNENSMEAIGRLIKESECVLICMCENYRMDERNQAEAYFAVRSNKPIIGVIIESEDHKRSGACLSEAGWLGDVMRDRVTVRLSASKEELHESVKKLVEHINEQRNIEKWTSNDVSEWFDSNNIHPSITKLYGVFDGFTLKQIYNMKKLTPEFYYQTLANETNHEITSMDIAFFAQKLENLFNNYKMS